ncbi:MAG TPA: hypothetical protein VLA62_06190 [Solirubrobacterales bacterium]|nr:hypothetical protein [Solirubrobacterales bacterium]
MSGARVVATVFLVGCVLLGPGGLGAQERPNPGGIDLHAVYRRVEPGMTVEDVARVSGRPALSGSSRPVTSWVIWSPPATGRSMEVLRAAFRDGQLIHLEYEVFGDEYRRLAKGADPALEMSEGELRRLWRRDWRLTQAVERCEEALEGFHQLALGFQERLTSAEQAAWVHALGLRRAAERELGALRR